MALGRSAFSNNHEETRPMPDGAVPYLCFMLVRGFGTISLLRGLSVEDHQNGFMALGHSAFSGNHEETRPMPDGAVPYLCFVLVRGFGTISLLGGLGVEDHQNGFRQAHILLNVVYFCAVGGKFYR